MPMTVELSALVHHIELTRSGWRDRALELMAVSTFFARGVPQELDEVVSSLNQQVPAPLGRAQIKEVLNKATSRGTLLALGDDRYKLAEAAEVELESNLSQSRENAERVATLFDSLMSNLSDEDRPSWESFYQDFLTPLVSELGLRTYEVLSQEVQEVDRAAAYRNYLDRFDEQTRGAVADRLSRFLDPDNRDVRRFVLRELNAQMLVRSTALSAAAYSALEKATQGNLRLTAFLDTNFLFSLIGLHDNPADDVVVALKQILPRVKGHVDVRLYVLPITVDEARETIARYRDKLAGITLGRSLASAARTRFTEMSGITLKYVQEATRGDRTLSAKEYFRPYIDDLISICRDRGVEFYNTDLSELRTDQKVIDDLNDQIEFQERRREKGAKPYPVILHDMVLWHFANRLRPVRVESPLEAEYWVATIDFGLLGFDAHKNRGRGKGVPLCIHPTVLLQMLQFWIPQSDELERALIDSLRPMLPHEYDRESEETTISMLQAVSRFEGIDDLGEEVLGRVLINDALRTRVRATREVAEQVELVREAIVNEAAFAKQEAEAAKEEMAQLLRTVSAKEAELDGMREELVAVRAEATDENRRLSEALLESRSAQGRLEKRLDRVEDERREERAARKATIHNALILLGIIVLTAVSAIAGLSFMPDVLLDWLDIAPLVATAAGPLVSVGGVLSLIDLVAPWFLQRQEYVVLEKLHQTRRWLWGLVGLVIIGLLVNYLYDALVGGDLPS